MFIEYTKVLLARVQILRDYLSSDNVDPKNSLNLCPCISIVRREFNVNISNRVLARPLNHYLLPIDQILAPKVCAKSGVGKKTGLKNLAFRMNLQENCLRKGNL
jgi:hypothetical protein